MKVNLILLKNFNNYFNRRIIRYGYLRSYLSSVDDYYSLNDTNFNPNDGITTEHVIGSANNKFSDKWSPDYVLVTDVNDVILSRWFVIEFQRLMTGQYQMSLKRDSVADKYEAVIKAPCYIEKGYLNNNDPMIVNSEGLNANQIKTREYYLKDKTKIPWIIAYIPQKRDSNIHVDVLFNTQGSAREIEKDADLRALFFDEASQTIRENATALEYKAIERSQTITHLVTQATLYGKNFGSSFSLNGGGSTQFYPQGAGSQVLSTHYGLQWDEIGFKHDLDLISNRVYNLIINDYNGFVDYTVRKAGCDYRDDNHPAPKLNQGEIVYSTTTKKFYQISYESHDDDWEGRIEEDNTSGYLLSKFQSAIDQGDLQRGEWYIFTSFSVHPGPLVNIKRNRYNYRLTPVSEMQSGYDIPSNTKHVNEVPYDIIAFPYGDVDVKLPDGSIYRISKMNELASARSLAQVKENCYDIQILPYCPCKGLIDENGLIDLSLGIENEDFVYIKEGTDEIKGVVLIAVSAFLPLQIKKLGVSILTDEEVDVSSVLSINDRKLQNETEMYRLCSPNYASAFEFKSTKLIPLGNDHVDWFDVNITFRPYTPYIRVAPRFSFLYGQNYDDARGLICNGDFGITLVDDKFLEYQLQNKNYQNMFNREIENLETNRAISREKDMWNIDKSLFEGVAGTIFGGVIGGAVKGGAPGAIMGGVGGALSGGLGMASANKQAGWNERAYQETRDFKIDMFNMQMDNIRALPASITQSSSISFNFKFFPVLEFYTCLPIEKLAIKNKIKYNGMTVGRIDEIENYLSENEERFIKGQIIRLDKLGEDSHLANDIYDEVTKGLFFNPGDQNRRNY